MSHLLARLSKRAEWLVQACVPRQWAALMATLASLLLILGKFLSFRKLGGHRVACCHVGAKTHPLKFFFLRFICLFLAVLGRCCFGRAFSSCSERGPPFVVEHRL